MSRLILLLATTFATILAVGLWIPLKALAAQELLELAWAESQAFGPGQVIGNEGQAGRVRVSGIGSDPNSPAGEDGGLTVKDISQLMAQCHR